VHGAAAPLRLPPGPAWGTVEVTRDRIWYRGHYESTYPAGVPYLIVAARDARGAELVRALLKTAKGSEVAIVVDDGDRPPRLVAMRAGDAPTHEARVAIGTTALRACRGHDLAPATPPAIAAACKADGCDGAAIVSLDGDATVDALVRAVDDLGAAGLDRVAIAPAIRCP
jgi:hypothetical protein